jgi:hypothetical protein
VVHNNKDFYSFAALYTYEALPMDMKFGFRIDLRGLKKKTFPGTYIKYKAFPMDKYEVCFPIDYGGA